MSTAVDHAYSRILTDAALGAPPATDPAEMKRRAQIVGALPGPCDAVAFLPGNVVVAADVDEDWVWTNLGYQQDRTPEDPSTGLGMFLGALRERLGNPPMYASVLAAAPHRAAILRGKLTKADDESEPGWSAYRENVQCYRYKSGVTQGYIEVGRGPGGRMDGFVRVDSTLQGGGGPSRELISTGLTLVRPGEQLFGSAPVHDTRALRTMLSGGFTPICTEVLFLTRPRR